MLDTQGAHRGQALAGAIEALLDAGAEQLGEVEIERHGILLLYSELRTSTVKLKNRHSAALLPILYEDNKPVLDLY
ncbi:hypothetical protein QMN21_23635 [Serratia sp. Se-PFBMAAmG]|nr:hypothetical protein [Serratia sp. Se-PFBMAAmG]